MNRIRILSVVLALLAILVTAVRPETRGVLVAQLRPFNFQNPPNYDQALGREEDGSAQPVPLPDNAGQVAFVLVTPRMNRDPSRIACGELAKQ